MDEISQEAAQLYKEFYELIVEGDVQHDAIEAASNEWHKNGDEGALQFFTDLLVLYERIMLMRGDIAREYTSQDYFPPESLQSEAVAI